VTKEDLLVRPGKTIRLADVDPGFTSVFRDKEHAQEKLASDVTRLAELQDVFAAARTHALLIVLQGMDSSGKDGAIKHVMSGVNPQGVDVYGFKAPTDEERAHDFLWRCQKVLPMRGRIGIFNRSYYEEVLVVRVHHDLLAQEDPSRDVHGAQLWQERYEDINAFECHLARCSTVVVKFFLHLSKGEQRRRLLKRIDDPSKNWKFSENDVTERRYWDHYMRAYEHMLNATSTKSAPWHIVPSDHKWFMRTMIADVLVSTLEALSLRYPTPGEAERATLERVKADLEP
jgi:PPK2 family polyphosphate:nucleotide phosphotransferase